MEAMGSPAEQPEKVTSAALRYDGVVYTGASHLEAYEALVQAHGSDQFNKKIEEGFATTTRNFIDRASAYDIAKEEDQLKPGVRRYRHDTLDSADFTA